MNFKWIDFSLLQMGKVGESILCYGIEFKYSEIKSLKEHPEFEKMAENWGSEDLSIIWNEFENQISGLNEDIFNANEEDYYYIIGKIIDNDQTLSNFLNCINENETKKIKDICIKYNLDYREPKIISRSTIYL